MTGELKDALIITIRGKPPASSAATGRYKVELTGNSTPAFRVPRGARQNSRVPTQNRYGTGFAKNRVNQLLGKTMAQSNNTEYSGSAMDLSAGAELNRTEALSLLRLLSPQASERTYFSASVLHTPNGGQLYVTPNLHG